MKWHAKYITDLPQKGKSRQRYAYQNNHFANSFKDTSYRIIDWYSCFERHRDLKTTPDNKGLTVNSQTAGKHE